MILQMLYFGAYREVMAMVSEESYELVEAAVMLCIVCVAYSIISLFLHINIPFRMELLLSVSCHCVIINNVLPLCWL